MTQTLDIPQRYVLPVERSDWPELLHEWNSLLPRDCLPWVLSKFGELFVCQSDQQIGMLQVSAFQYAIVAKNKADFCEWLADPDKMAEWFLAPLVDQLEAAGRLLSVENCYSFRMPLGLGGALTLDNVATLPIREHFGCLGEVFRQIKDLPDGSEVELKVID